MTNDRDRDRRHDDEFPIDFGALRQSVSDLRRRVGEGERRMDRMEGRIEMIPSIDTKVTSLQTDVRAIVTKLDSQGSGRRGEWTLAVSIMSLGLFAIMGVATLILTAISKVVH